MYKTVEKKTTINQEILECDGCGKEISREGLQECFVFGKVSSGLSNSVAFKNGEHSRIFCPACGLQKHREFGKVHK